MFFITQVECVLYPWTPRYASIVYNKLSLSLPPPPLIARGIEASEFPLHDFSVSLPPIRPPPSHPLALTQTSQASASLPLSRSVTEYISLTHRHTLSLRPCGRGTPRNWWGGSIHTNTHTHTQCLCVCVCVCVCVCEKQKNTYFKNKKKTK